jgi:1-deoxy-D-xylulose-5-phosphate reductoisomerase
MRTPFAQSLAFPERIDACVPALELARRGSLTFEAPDRERFPSIDLAYLALGAGGTAPAVLNAANEVAVAAFLAGQIRFTDIAPACAETLGRVAHRAAATLEDALAADTEARSIARSWLKLTVSA